MTKFPTVTAARNAAKAFIRETLGWESGNGYRLDYSPSYWNGRTLVPGYYTAWCRYSLDSSDSKLI